MGLITNKVNTDFNFSGKKYINQDPFRKHFKNWEYTSTVVSTYDDVVDYVGDDLFEYAVDEKNTFYGSMVKIHDCLVLFQDQLKKEQNAVCLEVHFMTEMLRVQLNSVRNATEIKSRLQELFNCKTVNKVSELHSLIKGSSPSNNLLDDVEGTRYTYIDLQEHITLRFSSIQSDLHTKYDLGCDQLNIMDELWMSMNEAVWEY